MDEYEAAERQALRLNQERFGVSVWWPRKPPPPRPEMLSEIEKRARLKAVADELFPPDRGGIEDEGNESGRTAAVS